MKKLIISLVIITLSLAGAAGCGKSGADSGEAYNDITVNMGIVAQNEDSYLIGSVGFFELDKDSLILDAACRDATCNHTSTSCSFNSEVRCIRNINGSILLTRSGLKEIYQLNSDTYEMSEYYKVSADSCNEVYQFYIYDDKLIYSAFNKNGEAFLYAEDMDNGHVEELLDRKVDICDISDDGIMYVYTSEFEPYAIDMNTLETIKLSDEKVRDIECTDDKLYYIKIENDVKILCVSDKDGNNEKILAEDIIDYKIYEDRIYYTKDNYRNVLETGKLYSSDLYGENEKVLIEGIGEINSIYILPDIGKVFIFNSIAQYSYEEYRLIDFDGSNLYSGEVPSY